MSNRFSFDPRSDFKNYREAVRRLLEDGWVLPRDLMPSPMNAVVIPVDVLDNGPDLIIKASLPGVNPEDVSISVLGKTLTIKASSDEADDMSIRGATYLRRERRASAFARSLSLPLPVDAERAEARFKNGVLILTLPKSESVRPRTIQVSSE